MCQEIQGYVAVYGWKNIAKMFGVSITKMMQYREELIENGIVFYTIKPINPRKRVMAFPAILAAWSIERFAGGKIF